MIVKVADIYKEVAEKNNLNPDLVVSVGNIVFASLLEKLMNPEKISYELPKIGAFNLRHKTFRNYYKTYMMYLNSGAIKNQEDATRVQSLMKQIEEFGEKKKEAKQKRDEYRKNKSNQSSQNKSEEHKEISTGILEKSSFDDWLSG